MINTRTLTGYTPKPRAYSTWGVKHVLLGYYDGSHILLVARVLVASPHEVQFVRVANQQTSTVCGFRQLGQEPERVRAVDIALTTPSIAPLLG